MDKKQIYDEMMKYPTKEDAVKHAIDTTAKFVFADMMSLLERIIKKVQQNPRRLLDIQHEVAVEYSDLNLRWVAKKIGDEK